MVFIKKIKNNRKNKYIMDQTSTEAEYRALKIDSSSSLKDFSMDRKKYRKKYVYGERVEEKENLAANMGRIVETLLLEPEEFDNRFYLSSCTGAPTGLMLEFTEALYKVTKAVTDEDGMVNADFNELTQEAYKLSGFKIKYEAVMGKFIDSDAEVYYNEIRTVRSRNLTVITLQEISNAEKIVEELKINDVTAGIVNLINSDRYTILDQYKIQGYVVDNHLFKSMLDKVVIDHRNKTVTPYDLKCVWSVEGFYEDYYLYRRAYIQAFLYFHAMLALAQDPNGPCFEYKVEYVQFIICDSINYFNPLIYTLELEDMEDAYNGFVHKGRTYPGVKSIISDLLWAQSTDIWHISRKNYENKGITNIKG
jgi:hypothetical protein